MESGNFQVHRSNRTEHLVEALFRDLEAPLASPFQKELLIVQGQGMATWLSMQLCQRAGVWANAEYLYPKHFSERIFELVLGTSPKVASVRERYSPDSLLWTIAARLPQHFDDPAFEALRDYVGNPLDEVRLFSLAGKIAETFDEYLTYRPELIRLWSKAEGVFAEPQLELFDKPLAADPAIWQRKLWRDIESVLGSDHPAALEKRCQQALSRRKKFPGLPERISLFGLSALPPMYVRLLAALSKHTQVRLYLPSPCEEYFGDILFDTPLSSSETTRHLRAADGNRLLRALGVQAAEFNHVITQSCESQAVAEDDHPHYVAPSSQTVLHALQRNVLTFSEQPFEGALKNDGSITVHSCHSPTREVEVLHDQILDLVHGQGYRPDDILVLLPDVESYAPLIDAVFRRSDERFLPYRIADRRMESESAVVKAFLRTLDLASTRVTAAQVMDLLSLAPVHRHFDIAATDLATLNEWVAEANITWGIDAPHRQSELPDTTSDDNQLQNTWRAGLDRLLMGYAIDTRGQELIHGVFPYEHVEGKTGLLLGKFANFARTLFCHLERIQHAHTVVDWQERLSALVRALIDVGQDEHWQLQAVLDALAALRDWSHQAGYEQQVSIHVTRQLLNQRLEQQGGARGFLAGGLTLSALIPMRTVPFRVICLMGMNDGAFPREAYRTDFNLLEHGEEKRRLGDPNRQKDDRYLFLEAVCSAREKLIVTYVGQSIRDNSVRAPSIVVVELLESIGAMAPQVEPVLRHPLQPFSPRYFDQKDPALHSYASEFVPKVPHEAHRLDEEGELGFFPRALPPRDKSRVLPLSELLKFFRSPTRYLLENRLGLSLRADQVGLHEHDATALSPLEGYAVGAALLDRVRSGMAVDASRRLTFAQGALPRGQLGNYEHAKMEETASAIATIAGALLRSDTPTHVTLRAEVGAFTIEGTIANVYASKRVHVQFSRLRGRGLLPQWVEHLLLSLHTKDEQLTTWLVGRDMEKNEPAVACFEPVPEPLTELSTLLELFELGSRVPIPLFPDLSFTFAHNPKAGDYQWDKGWQELLNQEEVIRRVYGQHSHLSLDRPMVVVEDVDIPTFQQVSERVFTPLLRHLRFPEWRGLFSDLTQRGARA